jgi:hypothetical protein
VAADERVAGREAGRLRTLLSEPTLPVLLLASVAMVRRGYLPDIALTAGTAALVVLDAPRWGFRTASGVPTAPPCHRSRTALLLLVAAAAMAALPRTSRRLDLACAVAGVIALWLVLRPGPGTTVGSPRAPDRWWVWPLLGVALALVELWGFLHRADPLVDDPAHPELSTLVEPVLDPYAVRVLFLWAWLLSGWWLVRRVRAWAR